MTTRKSATSSTRTGTTQRVVSASGSRRDRVVGAVPAQPAKKTTSVNVAKSTPAPAKSTPAPAKSTPAPAKSTAAPAIDFAALADGASVVAEMPPITRQTTSGNPFIARVRESFAKRTPFALPALPDDDVAKIVYRQIRTAARTLNVGVTVRRSITDEGGIVLTFVAHEKQIRDAE